jgi:hypothetical protein
LRDAFAYTHSDSYHHRNAFANTYGDSDCHWVTLYFVYRKLRRRYGACSACGMGRI